MAEYFNNLSLLLLLSGVVLGLGTSVSFGQTADPLAIRVESREVVVPVFVLEKARTQVGWTFSGEEPIYRSRDKEITGLVAKNFHVFEDGVEQKIQNVTVEFPRVWEVRDNVSHHTESSCTPRGIWSGPDAGTQAYFSHWFWGVYLVSYVPPPSPDGFCHGIRVTVDRPHAIVHARNEYCNTKHPASDPLEGTEIGKQLEDYARSPQGGQIPLSAQVGSFFGSSDTRRIDIAVGFPSNTLNRNLNDTGLEATIAVLGMVYDKDGALAARFSDSACYASVSWNAYNGPPPIPRSIIEGAEFEMLPNRYETQIDLPAGNYDMKLVVTDGEKFGRVEVPLVVGSSPRDLLAMSGIALCKRYHKVLAELPETDQAPQYVPLVSNGIEFTPAGDTQFRKSQQLVSYFEVYEPQVRRSGAPKVHLQMRVTDAQTGEVKTDTGLRPLESAMRKGNGVIPVAREIAIDKLPPGTYRLEVQASDSAGSRTFWRAATFTVE